MLQRFKSALDKSIAEEQERQKQRANAASPASNSRPQSVSRTNSSAAKRKAKKPGQDAANGAEDLPNTDPAVFEAAFALDDEEAEAKAAAASPENGDASEKGVKGDESADAAKSEKPEAKETTENEKTETNGDEKKKAAPALATVTDLPPEVQAKLRKLSKLEKTYPGTYPQFATTVGVVVAQDLFGLSIVQAVALILRATRTLTLLSNCAWSRHCH